MITIEVYWDDLTESKQNEIREALNMESDDNGNWEASEAATNALKNIVLVRNFARVRVTNLTDNFVLSGFHVFRTENAGCFSSRIRRNSSSVRIGPGSSRTVQFSGSWESRLPSSPI